MKVIDFSKSNSIINKYMAEMRDKDYQHNRLLFRNNIMRVGELIASSSARHSTMRSATSSLRLASQR